ncbi:MAG: imidazole glycerol phosphate synthase subunit HisH, partial [Nitrosopumilus sp.]|nr:imidazole glycerol phosphate synthase subunit HisH [Nitrosopumilus sp.]
VIEKNNFFGTQFHPEKSSKVGKIMIENFLSVCKK